MIVIIKINVNIASKVTGEIYHYYPNDLIKPFVRYLYDQFYDATCNQNTNPDDPKQKSTSVE